MADHDFSTLTQELLDDSVQVLLPPVPPSTEASSASLTAVAVIGFAGDKVRGTLGLAASEGGLDALSASVGAELNDVTASLDSLGELANLILGEVKRGWARRGIDVTISTPQMLRGVEIQVCGSDRLRAPGSEWFAANGEGTESIKVWLDAHPREAIELVEEAEAGAFADQGDAILF